MDLPEASVENQHHVFPSGVGFQTRRAIQTAGQGELIPSFGNYAVNRQILAGLRRQRIFSRRTGPGADGQRHRGKENEKEQKFLVGELGHIGQPNDRLLLNTCPRPNQIEGRDGAFVAVCRLLDVRVVVHADVAFLFQNGIFLGAATQQFLINVLVVLAQPHWAASNL